MLFIFLFLGITVLGHQIGKNNKTMLLLEFADGYIGQVGLYDCYHDIKEPIVKYVDHNKLVGSKGFGIVTKYLTPMSEGRLLRKLDKLYGLDKLSKIGDKTQQTNEQVHGNSQQFEGGTCDSTTAIFCDIKKSELQFLKWKCLQYGIDVTYLVAYYRNGPGFEEDELIEVNYGIYTTLLSKVNLYKKLGKDKHCTSITFENYTKFCYEYLLCK